MSAYKYLIIIVITACWFQAFGQEGNLERKSRKFKTLDKQVIFGEVGYLTVPENRKNPNSRNIKIKYIRLKSLAENPEVPTLYLEGGGSACTWQAESPKDLSDWLPILQVSDLIFIDQRGTTDKKLTYIWNGEFPKSFFVSEEEAAKHYQDMCINALAHFEEKNIDVRGYHIEEHAQDISQLMQVLKIDRYSIFGFSFGTHIGMALLKLEGSKIQNSVMVGADGINQSFNLPTSLDTHVEKLSQLILKSDSFKKNPINLSTLLTEVLDKLEKEPAMVTVMNPLTKKKLTLLIGRFGLALILRLDIDDANDIPVIPRLLNDIQEGNYDLLNWFVQKRLPLAMAVPGNGINQGIASGVSEQRRKQIELESKQSPFGNVVNFPFSPAIKVWSATDLQINTSQPIQSEVRTLFVTGDLDARTSVSQVNEIAEGFTNSTHLIVENAGHEQAMWDLDIFDVAIPDFLRGNDVEHIQAYYDDITFIDLTGPSNKHPSLK